MTTRSDYNERDCCDRECPGGCGRPSCECECIYDGDPDWSSGPLPLLPAVRVWCAGAGTEGAYFPDILDRLAADICHEQITLAQLIEETCRRLDWITDFCQSRDLLLPRNADYSRSSDTLEWRTSVTVRLRPRAPAGAEYPEWEVMLFGEHIRRQPAMEYAIHRLEEGTHEKK